MYFTRLIPITWKQVILNKNTSQSQNAEKLVSVLTKVIIALDCNQNNQGHRGDQQRVLIRHFLGRHHAAT